LALLARLEGEGRRSETMDEQFPEVEAHLFKEAAVTAAAAGALFAGTAQARPVDPDPGDATATVVESPQAAPQKVTKHKDVKPHVRQRNRADFIDP
jgi:hypothetical protein